MRTLIRVVNPRWADVEAKDRFIGTFVYDDESSMVMSVAVHDDNPEYQQFLQVSSIEAIDQHTQELRDALAIKREEDIAIQADRTAQKKANALFNTKIEAFEVPEVQAASTEMKARIRKATTAVEVIAIVTAILLTATNAAAE